MTSHRDTPDPAESQGGTGGLVPPTNLEKQMARSRGVRQRRMERHVAEAKLKLANRTAADVGVDAVECLGTLRAGLDAGVVLKTTDLNADGVGEAQEEFPDFRERRLSAEAILHHHREVVKLGGEAGTPGAQGQGPRELHLHIHAPADPEAERALLQGLAQATIEAESVIPPRPDGGLNGHATNGHAKNGTA